VSLRHPSRTATPLRLYGRRVMMRPLAANDFREWSEVRRRNHDWLTVWEPSRQPHHADPVLDRGAFTSRCLQRDRDRASGTAYQFGLFLDQLESREDGLDLDPAARDELPARAPERDLGIDLDPVGPPVDFFLGHRGPPRHARSAADETERRPRVKRDCIRDGTIST